ncbi:MAG: hypothetical protein B6D61_00180, partial [Bacteroidetes bacterium 4484_249]
MQTFLHKTAKYIIDKYGTILGDICIVLPNRRAGLFLKKNLAGIAGKTIWSPAIYSIEDFIVELSGYNVIDPVYLQFELYEIHKEIEKTGAQEFGEFLKWGKVLLNDFNEIDMYLVDAGQLFGHLTDTKALAVWNVGGEPLTDFEIKYLRFFNSLKKYYDRLSDKLLEKNQVYQGLAYRKLSEQIESDTVDLPWSNIVFAGFNALTAAEEKIIFTLKKTGKAELLWDADTYYLDNKIQEAGRFIRKYKKKFDEDDFRWIDDCFSTDKKEISVLGVPQNVGQVKVTAQVLTEMAGISNEMHNTAVVLNNESLIIPLLNSIPETLKEFNLTMGLPLNDTPLSNLIEGILNLHENSVKFDKTGGKAPKFYFRDIIKIFEHPYLRIIAGAKKIESVLSEIRNSNRIFFDYNELVTKFLTEEEDNEIPFSVFLEPWSNSPQRGIEKIIKFLDTLKSAFTDNRNSHSPDNTKTQNLEMEYLFHFSKVFKKLKNLIIEYPYIENIKTLREMYNQIVQFVSIPFYGEPLKGLQIMGMLETRTLDFDNIIMLSVNEDFIPAGKSDNSFIPFDIKREFKLPTYRERNAVFAYHFYRILQRAENIYLLYNTEAGDLGGGDKSRFITQLQYEMAKYNPRIKINEKILSVPPVKEKINDKIEITKSPDILKRIENHAKNGYSASALNTYRNCSLQYYFKYLAGLDETEDVEETIEANTLGTVVHDVLSKLYEPFVGKNITAGDINLLKSKTELFIRKSFEENYKNGEI